jgi:hypothetical protein
MDNELEEISQSIDSIYRKLEAQIEAKIRPEYQAKNKEAVLNHCTHLKSFASSLIAPSAYAKLSPGQELYWNNVKFDG